ncbi:MAG: IS21 family transposase [Actinomycetota bacterium]|nr:IS21 family transposase [Actinomycetota bacterium]
MTAVALVAVASSGETCSPETLMVKEEVVEAVLGALARGDAVLAVARAYGLDPKTVRTWRRRGRYRPRDRTRVRSGLLAPFATWLKARAPEVDFNAVVLHRELREQGFTGSEIVVRRAVRPWRLAAEPAATVRFESAPGEQAQVDFGQVRVWIGDVHVPAQIFVYTLGYSRCNFAVAFRQQRLREWIAGHELAFQHFGGVPDRLIVDNAKAMVLRHTREALVWNTTYADFTAYYGVRPWACAPYRPQTKGKVESGVKYIQRNALAGKRFASWDEVNAWLLEWTTTIADRRVHGTTHEIPAERFKREALTPLGNRPPYEWARVRRRIVAADALVSVAGSRYSVPARLVGATVEVHESATGFAIQHADTVVAEHARRPRHQVVMDPAHYAGLLRVDRTPLAVQPPLYDPRYQHVGTVEARDLAIYEAIADVCAGGEGVLA